MCVNAGVSLTSFYLHLKGVSGSHRILYEGHDVSNIISTDLFQYQYNIVKTSEVGFNKVQYTAHKFFIMKDTRNIQNINS